MTRTLYNLKVEIQCVLMIHNPAQNELQMAFTDEE